VFGVRYSKFNILLIFILLQKVVIGTRGRNVSSAKPNPPRKDQVLRGYLISENADIDMTTRFFGFVILLCALLFSGVFLLDDRVVLRGYLVAALPST
jgi:hypothetical protein